MISSLAVWWVVAQSAKLSMKALTIRVKPTRACMQRYSPSDPFFLLQSGSYRSYLVHEDLVVTERIDDIKPLGFYIRRLCDGKDTYRMQRRASLPG